LVIKELFGQQDTSYVGFDHGVGHPLLLLCHAKAPNYGGSYWIPGSYAPTLPENRDSFLRLLKNNDFKEERMTKVGLDAIGTSTTLESNKSLHF
jgi:hypothetical protein